MKMADYYLANNTVNNISTQLTCAPLTRGGMMIWEPCLDDTC